MGDSSSARSISSGASSTVVAGAEAAGGPVNGDRLDFGAALDGGQSAELVGDGLELEDAGRGDGAQVVRPHQRHHRLEQLGDFVVEFLADAAGQKRDALEQPFDVGVGLGRFEHVRDGWIGRGELAAHLAQKR